MVGVVLALLLVSAGCAAAEWESRQSPPTRWGWGQAIVTTDSGIYLARCEFASTSPEFYFYDPLGDRWTTKSTTGLPVGAFRSGTAVAWDGDGLIYALLGARQDDSNRTLFYRYSITDDAWTRLKDTPHAQGAGNALTWSGYDQMVYAFLGSRTHGGSRFARFDPTTGDWTVLSIRWRVTDDGASLAWAGGEYIYALQGEADEHIPNVTFARFHIPTGTWDGLPGIPDLGGVGDGASLLWVGRWVPEATRYVFALGGSAGIARGRGFFAFDTYLRRWITLPDLPYPVGYTVGNRLGYGQGKVYYWQGSPGTWPSGGNSFQAYPVELIPAQP